MEAIMEIDEVEIVEVELKYCERCGGLWLRVMGDEQVYCVSCIPLMAELPVARKVKYRLPNNHTIELDNLESSFFAAGGNA